MTTMENAVVALFKVGRNAEGWWLVVTVDGQPHDRAGPFETEDEANAARDDLMQMGRECGGIDMPGRGH